MHRLHGGYAQYFNRRHGLVGPPLPGPLRRGDDRERSAVVMTAAYIARNPVDAGLCRRRRPTGSGAATPRSSRAALPRWLDSRTLAPYFGATGGDGLKPLPGASSTRLSTNLKGTVPFRWAGGGRAEQWAEEPEDREEGRDRRRRRVDDPGVVEEVRDHRDREDDRDAEEDEAGDRVVVGGLDDVDAVGLVEAQAVGRARGDQADRRERRREQRRVEEGLLGRGDAREALRRTGRSAGTRTGSGRPAARFGAR